MTERSLIVLSLPAPVPQEIETVTRLSLPVPGGLPKDSMQALVESGRRYEGYVITLTQRLNAIVKEVEKSVEQAEVLDVYARDLRERETKRSHELVPVLLRIRRTLSLARGPAASSPAPAALAMWETLLTVELESFRDARLRIEFKKARVLNSGQPPRKSIRSGVEVRMYFTGLRADAASTN